MKPLDIRLRSDLRDLNDEEFTSYLESMQLDADLELLRDVQNIQRKSMPKKRKVKTFKTVMIKGKRKRIPVGHYVEETVKEKNDLPEGDGSIFLMEFISPSTAILDYLERSDECFEILIGYTKVGDIVEVDAKWGVVSEITNEEFTLLYGCGTLESLTYKLYQINQNYRIVS